MSPAVVYELDAAALSLCEAVDEILKSVLAKSVLAKSVFAKSVFLKSVFARSPGTIHKVLSMIFNSGL